MADFSWGIVGPGAIAHRFAQAVSALPGHRLQAVWGRDPGRTQAFAQRWAVAGAPAPRAAVSMDDLLADPALDAVYIATPHPQHAVAAAAALQAGRAVLCEKPLTPTAADTAALLALSASRGVFLMEALWTRLLPLYDQIGARIRAGAIGEIRHIEASFGFAVPEDPASRLFDPAQAGGALLDIGIYPLAMTRWALQAERRTCPEPAHWQVHGERAGTGVDRRVHGRLQWPDGVVAEFRCGFDAPDDNALRLVGTRGRIDVPHEFWQATHAVWTDAAGRTEALHAPFAVNGFEYEVAEVARAVREGRTESPRMPHAESLALACWLDSCRAAVGVRYPFEP